MTFNRPVLCPVDFSDSSRGALRYAGAIAAHLGVPLTLLAVNDPLLAEAADITGSRTGMLHETMHEMKKFAQHAFGTAGSVPDLQFDVANGKPAAEILRVAGERGAGLIVIASHGATGFRKLFFGSTTERVLRETLVPTLVTPGNDPGPTDLEEARKLVRRLLVPIDLTAATPQQLVVAGALARALSLPLLMLHVVEPVRSLVAARAAVQTVETERRYRVEAEMERLDGELQAGTKVEELIAYGEPAEEIVKVAHDRDAGLIVVGLHSSLPLGRRMGSVTYRVLCLAHRLVLALPPQALSASVRRVAAAVAVQATPSLDH